MKYQIKGSTVAFTNKSVQTENVTAWLWQIATSTDNVTFGSWSTTGIDTPNGVNMNLTFPTTAGLYVKVRLTASGTWGSDIIFEQTYQMVYDIAPPVIQVPDSFINNEWHGGLPFEHQFTVIDGAGDITWAIEGGSNFATIDSATGKLTMRVGTPNLVANVLISATDVLGRKSYKEINKTASAVSVIKWYESTDIVQEAGVITSWPSKTDNVNGVSVGTGNNWDYEANVINGYPVGKIGSSATGTVYLSGGGTYNRISAAIIVVRIDESNVLRSLFSGQSTYIAQLLVTADNKINTHSKNLPMTNFAILAFVCTEAVAVHYIDNGFYRGTVMWYAGNTYPGVLGRVSNSALEAVQLSLAEMMIFNVNASSLTAPILNDYIQYLSAKYNIPCMQLTAYA